MKLSDYLALFFIQTGCTHVFGYQGGAVTHIIDSLYKYKENIRFVRNYLEANLPQIKLIEPDGTYLIWLDFRGLGLSEQEREELIVKKAGLWLDSGAMFGPIGVGFERINIACPRALIIEALDKLRAAIKNL